MQKSLLVVIMLLVMTACRQTDIAAEPPSSRIQNVANPEIRTIADTNTTAAAEWIETEIEGVDVGVWLPSGWQSDTTGGLTLAERMTSIDSGAPASGMVVYFFVPDMDEIFESAGDNAAYMALHAVAGNPDLTHGAVVSAPESLDNPYADAAFYLYADMFDRRGLVIAIALKNEQKLIVANMMVSASDADRFPELVSSVLRDLRINRQPLGSALIEALPASLMFPSAQAAEAS